MLFEEGVCTWISCPASLGSLPHGRISPENEGAALAYMQQHAQEMDEQIMMQHVALYVNKYSIDLGEEGRAAVTKMFNLAQQKGVIPEIKNALFVV